MIALSLMAVNALIAILLVVVVILYCNGLILISRQSQLIKAILSSILYLLFAFCLTAPLLLMILTYISSLSDVIGHWGAVLVIVLGHSLAISPGLLMLKIKYLHQLKRLGYYR